MTTPVEDFQPGDRFLENFRIEGVLGRGGMGKVYLAIDEWTEREVALKLIRHTCADLPEFMERFRRESKALARIEHPNLVQLYGAGRAPDGRLYVIMEHLFGLSLRKIIDAAGRLDLVSAIHFGVQIAEALSIAHARGILHRDVKPENVIVGMRGHVWVLDFGLAKSVESTVYTTDEKETGTPRYMSPEQIHTIPIDERADIYALGIVLYEMIAGRHPYPEIDENPAISDTRILAAHALAKAKPLPEIVPGCPDAVWQIIARCLAKKRDARHANAQALASDLRAVLRDTVALDPSNERRGERNLDIRECLPDLATALENADEAAVAERRRKALENVYASLPPAGRISLPPAHPATPVTAPIAPATKQGRWPRWAISALAVVAVIAPVTVMALFSSKQPDAEGKPEEPTAAPASTPVSSVAAPASTPASSVAAPASTSASSVAAPVASASAPVADTSTPGVASAPTAPAVGLATRPLTAVGKPGLPPRAPGELPAKPPKPPKPSNLPPEVF
jgi:serine/threonine protein kinase